VSTSGQASIAADGQLAVHSGQQRRRGRCSKPVTVTTSCSSGDDVTMATSSSNVHTNDTVPFMQKHCVISAPQLQHSVVAAPVNTGISRTGTCVVSEKQHSAVAGELAQQHSVDSQQRHSAVTSGYETVTMTDRAAVASTTHPTTATHLTMTHLTTTTYPTTTTHLTMTHPTSMTHPPTMTHPTSTTHPTTTTQWTTTTVKPTCLTTTQSGVDGKYSLSAVNPYYRDGLSAGPAVMYHGPGDCAVPMLWTVTADADRPTDSRDADCDDDDDDDDDDTGRCRLMMSPSSLHLVPLIAGPSPYPCVEPIYVDMASVAMATFGVGMPTAGIGIATDDVVMATHSINMAATTDNVESAMATADVRLAVDDVGMETGSILTGVGMATAGMADGLVGQCVMSVDDDGVVWPAIYECLPTLDHPHPHTRLVSLPPTVSAGLMAVTRLVDGPCEASSSLESRLHVATSSGPPATVTHAQSTLAPVTLGGPTCVSLSDCADSTAGVSRCCQTANHDGAATAAGRGRGGGGDVETGPGQLCTASRPDVVSSNIPRSHTTTTSCSHGNDHNYSCSSLPHSSHAALTTCTCRISTSTSSSSSSSSSNATSSSSSRGINGAEIDPRNQQQQQQQADHPRHDDDDEEVEELSDGRQQPISVDQQPALSSSSAAASSLSAGLDVDSCVRSTN